MTSNQGEGEAEHDAEAKAKAKWDRQRERYQAPDFVWSTSNLEAALTSLPDQVRRERLQSLLCGLLGWLG